MAHEQPNAASLVAHLLGFQHVHGAELAPVPGTWRELFYKQAPAAVCVVLCQTARAGRDNALAYAPHVTFNFDPSRPDAQARRQTLDARLIARGPLPTTLKVLTTHPAGLVPGSAEWLAARDALSDAIRHNPAAYRLSPEAGRRLKTVVLCSAYGAQCPSLPVILPSLAFTTTVKLLTPLTYDYLDLLLSRATRPPIMDTLHVPSVSLNTDVFIPRPAQWTQLIVRGAHGAVWRPSALGMMPFPAAPARQRIVVPGSAVFITATGQVSFPRHLVLAHKQRRTVCVGGGCNSGTTVGIQWAQHSSGHNTVADTTQCSHNTPHVFDTLRRVLTQTTWPCCDAWSLTRIQCSSRRVHRSWPSTKPRLTERH